MAYIFGIDLRSLEEGGLINPGSFLEATQIMAFKKQDAYGMNHRPDQVENQGWATMPGEKERDSRVAEEVVERLGKLHF